MAKMFSSSTVLRAYCCRQHKYEWNCVRL